MPEASASAPSNCFACGQDNPQGMRLRFEQQGDEVTAVWSPGSQWEGFAGVIHGGLVSTVLDEAMAKAVAAGKARALTAELRVRFRRPVTTGGSFVVRGWLMNRKGRMLEAEACVTAPDGTEHAHAWARFLAMPERP